MAKLTKLALWSVGCVRKRGYGLPAQRVSGLIVGEIYVLCVCVCVCVRERERERVTDCHLTK
jgi:hypothetical protein